MSKSLNMSQVEAQMMKCCLTPTTKQSVPGPGQYISYHDGLADINYNISSIEGSFSKAERAVFKPMGLSPGPSYTYSSFGSKKSTGGGFSKSKRFADPTPTPGFYSKVNRKLKPSSLEGTFSKAERAPLSLDITDSPGPCYDTRRPLVKPGRTGTIPKAERFPDPEEEKSPGPVYFPKPLMHGPAAKITQEERFRPLIDIVGPGPGTAILDIDKPVAKSSPSPTIKGKLKSERLPEGPGFIYYPNDTRGLGPAFSFAGPDPHQLAGLKRSRTPNGKLGSPKKSLAEVQINPNTPPQDMSGSGEEDSEDDEVPPAAEPTQPSKRQSAQSPSHKAASPSKPHGLAPIPSSASVGQDSPGPGQYLSLDKLFENRPSPRSLTMGRRLRHPLSDTPGPGSYNSPVMVGGKQSPSYKIGTAKRQLLDTWSVSPGPVYNNEKWPLKTPIRHGVASQTTNYTAKAEARARAERDAREQQQARRQMTALQSDVLPCDDEYVDYAPTRLDDVTTTTKDRFLMNVWY